MEQSAAVNSQQFPVFGRVQDEQPRSNAQLRCTFGKCVFNSSPNLFQPHQERVGSAYSVGDSPTEAVLERNITDTLLQDWTKAEHNKCTLSFSKRSQEVNITLGFTFKNDTSFYKTEALLSSFQLSNPHTPYHIHAVFVNCKEIILGTNYQTVVINTQLKTVVKFAFTYIVVYDPISLPNVYLEAFNFPMSMQISPPIVFDSIKQKNCIVGLKYFETLNIGAQSSHHILLSLSNSSNILALYELSSNQIANFTYATVCADNICHLTNSTDKNSAQYRKICITNEVQNNSNVNNNTNECIASRKVNGTLICLSCNLNISYSFLPINNICKCKQGYINYKDSNKCSNLCGDGTITDQQCDDGNSIDGDGCSSLCSVEQSYKCVQNTSSSASRCIYINKNISLTVKKISRSLTDNKATFIFSISPNLLLFKRLNISAISSFKNNRSYITQSLSMINDQITLVVDFKEDLEGYSSIFQINLPFIFFLQDKITIIFPMVSHDRKLIIINHLQQQDLLLHIMEIISIIYVSICFAGSLFHKMMGLQSLIPIQIIYLLHLHTKQLTPTYSLLGYLGNTAYNFLFNINNQWNIRIKGSNPLFSKQNEIVTIWSIFGITVSALLLLLIIFIVKTMVTRNQDERLTNIDYILRYMYNIYFYCSMSTFMVFYAMLSFIRSSQLQGYILLPVYLQALLLSLTFFYQFKQLFIHNNNCQHRLLYFKQSNSIYIPFFLTFLFIETLLLDISFLLSSIGLQYYLLSVMIPYCMGVIYIRPYRNNFHNVAITFTNVSAIIFIVWNILRNGNIDLRTEQNEFLAVCSVILGITLLSLFSIIRIVYQIILIIKKRSLKIDDFDSSDRQNNRRMGDGNMKRPDYQIGYPQTTIMFKYKLQADVINLNGEIPSKFFQKPKKERSIAYKQSDTKKWLKSYLLQNQSTLQ